LQKLKTTGPNKSISTVTKVKAAVVRSKLKTTHTADADASCRLQRRWC